MKKTIVLFSFLSLFFMQNCKKNSENIWKIEIKNPVKQVNITDISKEFYDPNVSLDVFKQKYPWFQGTVSDIDFIASRTDPDEAKIYHEAISKINVPKLNTDLADLFSHIQYYFPKFVTPKVFLYSSVLQSAKDPIFYQAQENYVFIDITGFMGDQNPNYKGLEAYFQASMNPTNIVPKVSEIFAEKSVPVIDESQKFIDQLVFNGKIMILQDAFLPNYPDALKMNATKKQYDWSVANEANIYNFFVENDLIFSADPRLSERFIAPGPFSKFFTEIDNQSSPQVGIFAGWQICKSFFKEKPDTKLTNFLKMNATEIFNNSHYKPKN